MRSVIFATLLVAASFVSAQYGNKPKVGTVGRWNSCTVGQHDCYHKLQCVCKDSNRVLNQGETGVCRILPDYRLKLKKAAPCVVGNKSCGYGWHCRCPGGNKLTKGASGICRKDDHCPADGQRPQKNGYQNGGVKQMVTSYEKKIGPSYTSPPPPRNRPVQTSYHGPAQTGYHAPPNY
jgi:hypothetical protein